MRFRHLFGILAGLLLTAHGGEDARELPVTLRLTDPREPDLGPAGRDLFLAIDPEGRPLHYRMPLFTAICDDNTCEPLFADLFWDPLGRPLNVVPPPDRPMTKYDHVPFTEEDHLRMAEILANPGSRLREMAYADLSAPVRQVSVVDGISGATPLAVREDVVAGAAYSTWVLWHWFHGEAPALMRELTRRHGGNSHLAHCLRHHDPAFVEFALQHLDGGGIPVGDEILDALITALGRADLPNTERILKLAEAHFEDRAELHRFWAGAAPHAEALPARRIFAALAEEPRVDPAALRLLAGHLPSMSFAAVGATLDLFETHPEPASELRPFVEAIAGHPNRFIARRAVRYLERVPRP
jgi:hypothetical protein